MKILTKTFYKGILAGLAIGLGSFLFVLCASFNAKALGSFLFSVGLFLVCTFSLYLYTGKIGFLPEAKNKPFYSLNLLIGYLGNLLGIVALGYLLRLICGSFLMETAAKVASSRIITENNWYITLGKSLFCGALVYIAVFVWKRPFHFLTRLAVLILCVAMFVYFGFEHCIANMFYISFANMWSGSTILNIVIVTFGNSVGALLVNVITRAFF